LYLVFKQEAILGDRHVIGAQSAPCFETKYAFYEEASGALCSPSGA